MKERKFYNDEFEELIRLKTDQYKMYPSDKVWKEIYNSLHTKRRRFIAGMSILITGILIIAGKELLTPSKHVGGSKPIVITNTQKTDPADVTATFQAFKKESFIQTPSPVSDNKPGTKQTLLFDIFADQPENKIPSPSADYSSISAEEITAGAIPKHIISNDFIEKPPVEINSGVANESLSNPIAVEAETIRKNNVTNYDASDKKRVNWLQEYALQHLTPIHKKRLTWQVNIAPTVNYRKLSGVDYDHIRSTVTNIPIALIHFGNINDFVDHTPAVGYEVGGSMLYRLTRNLSVKAGIQFSYSRYYIKAFTSNPQLATITLNSTYGYIPDSLTGYTNVSNFGGKSMANLQNRYYQLSAPIGLEMRVIGNGKVQFNVGGTIQPTYLLNRNSYLLTTDFTSYTKEPSLFRRWNVNGGLEAFLSYQTGGFRLQIGPQFRYQLFSTYTNKYPFKENLMEYGIKIGISKDIR